MAVEGGLHRLPPYCAISVGELERSSSQSLLPRTRRRRYPRPAPAIVGAIRKHVRLVGTGIGEEDLQHHGFQAIISDANRPR